MKEKKIISDEGVPRRYFEAKGNPMFDEIQRASIRFVEYKQCVSCALCGKNRKYHWTCVVRFKAADICSGRLVLTFPREWIRAGTPVCRDHILKIDRKEFMRIARAQRKLKGVQ